MKSKLALSLAFILASGATLVAQAGHDIGKAAEKTGHVSAVAAKDAARGSKKAVVETGDATKDVAKDGGRLLVKGGDDVGRGTKDAVVKTADVIK
jgi:hypothetical protein